MNFSSKGHQVKVRKVLPKWRNRLHLNRKFMQCVMSRLGWVKDGAVLVCLMLIK